MDWKAILHKGALRGGICFLLTAAIIMGLVLPGVNMEPDQPKDPLENESIREISVLKVGENISELQTIVVPNGGSAAPTEPEEPNSEETDPEETEPEENIPEETESEQPDISDGEEGNEEDDQGEEGGKELELDLAAVMTWYRYGNEPKTITCGPSKAVAKTLNVAQLKNNRLKYQFQLTGKDADFVEITSVSLAEGDSPYHQVEKDGEIEIQLPGGSGDRKYTFQVKAMAEKENDAGELIQQEVMFLFVMKCEYTMDLQMELGWKDKDGGTHTVNCGPDKAEPFSVENYDLNERIFGYTVKLTGTLADNAQIVEARYTTASGQRSGTLEMGGGSLILDPAPGSDTDTYYLTFTVKTQDRTVLYTYNLVYRQMLEVQLNFIWKEKGMISHTLTCQPGASTSERIKNNQLSAGAVPFELQLVGADAGNAQITSVSYTSDSGSGDLNESGSLAMTMPDGETSNTYRITVNALVNGQRMTFEIILYHANDVTLQMEYTVSEDGAKVRRQVTCENTKTRTAEAVYDDQLTAGLLEYQMSVIGSDAESVSITSVNCFQSGSGKMVTLGESGEVSLMLNDGKTGENTFTVQAKDDGGNVYEFTINIPYKHRGENTIKIETNLYDGQEIINGAKTNLTVKAWSEDSSGKVLYYIPANGVDTKLVVKLDDVVLSYISTSGANSEYDLVPENPDVGDTNEHILHIYAEDAYGNYGELTLTLMGQRREAGQKIGNAKIYVDMTVLGLGVVESLSYEVLADEPVSYVIAKALLGEDTGEPFGAAKDTLGWGGRYEGTLDLGFYLASLTTGHTANALEGADWPGSTEAVVLQAIDDRFGAGTGLATLWRCIYRNGLNKSEGSGGSFGEFDYTSGSGWMYSVGGTTYYPGQSMSAVYLQDGDSLTVRFTLAQGWDVGGGTAGYGSTVGYCVSAVNGSFYISHQMEEQMSEAGNEIYVCHCCGIVQDCAHENQSYLDLEDGSHILYCPDCKTTIGDVEAHSWDGDADASVHTCTVCGAEEDHKWVEDKNNPNPNQPTCTEGGYKNERCVICAAVREDIPVNPAGHDPDSDWDADTSDHWKYCEVCETEFNKEAHQFVYDENWEEFQCTVCEAWHSDACNDSYLTAKGQSGNMMIYHCDYCGCDLQREYDPSLGPDQTEPDDPEESEPTEHTHNWIDGDVLTEPGCETTGEMEIFCDGCDAIDTIKIDANGHTWGGEWETTIEPEVGVPGEKVRYCEVCKQPEYETIAPIPDDSGENDSTGDPEEASLFSRLLRNQTLLTALNNILSI